MNNNMNKMNLKTILVAAGILFSGCAKEAVETIPTSNETVFNYSNHSTWTGRVVVEGYSGRLSNVLVYILDRGEVVAKAVTNSQGECSFTVDVTSQSQLTVSTDFPTILTHREVVRDGATVTLKPNTQRAFYSTNKTGIVSTYSLGGNWYADRSFNSLGVPNHLLSDTISDSLLTYIYNTLPEQYPIGTHNAGLIADKATTLYMQDSGDVFMTYIHEGAGFKNVVGIYTYDSTTVPQTVGDVDTIWTAFINFSQLHSGGGLVSGDRIYLGSYPAGTYIGFALSANGYNGSTSSISRHHVHYSNPSLNAEQVDSLKNHNVVFYHEGSFVVGFEDINREYRSCDHDFNDAVFLVESNPIEALDTTDVAKIVTELEDSDYDGVADRDDIAPNDPNIASKVTSSGKLLFEDLYPYLGDYDFNDGVFNYTVETFLDGTEVATTIIYSFELLATGCSFDNGLGLTVEGLTSSNVSNVQFSSNDGYIQESGDSVMFILTDNYTTEFGKFINVQSKTDNSMTFSVRVDVSGASVGDIFAGNSLDPFIFRTQDSSRIEVHLADKSPTWLADPSKLLEGVNRYSNGSGLPWGLHIDHNTSHMIESIDIRQGYSHFNTWAESEGVLNSDWESFVDSTKIVK